MNNAECAVDGVPGWTRRHLPMVKGAIAAVVIAFLVFYIMTSPDQAADIVHNVWKTTVNVAHGIGHFFDKLAS
jgi:hypothetical protein